jgi:16S rRNA (cytosine967-C5)-methyltransferase
MVSRKDFRLISLKILNDTFTDRRWVKDSIEEYMGDINEEHSDISKIYELCYGILRNKTLIDFRLSKYIEKPVDDITMENILRIGWWQLKKMDSIPDYAAIDTCVELAKEFAHPKTAGFVNAVLRNVLRDKSEDGISKKVPEKYLSTTYSYTPWMVKFMLEYYPENAEAILAAGNVKPPFYLRVNTLKTTTPELIELLKQSGVEAEVVEVIKDAVIIKSGDPINTEAFTNGLFYVQDLASQSLGTFFAAGSEDSVIDVGSAPGGKAAFFSQTMQNKGKITAIEPDSARMLLINNTIVRLGLENITTMNHDATVDVPELHDSADKLLVDAPCSALGVIRRHPEKKWCLSRKELSEFPDLQYRILSTASAWVKKGGELFYSTCTINPEENEKLVEEFLANNTEFSTAPVTEAPEFSEYMKGDYFLSLPGNELDMDGFFIAKMVKK